MSQCVVPAPSAIPSTLAIDQLNTLRRTPLSEHISELTDRWPAVWLVNRAVAEAYGLGPEDFEHILSTFPVFARKRPAFHAYLLERLAEWKEETGTAGRRVRYPEKPARSELRVAESPPEAKGSP